MGFRFRKSINLGGGFRVNLSKSGIGYSWGTKGLRFTKTANGRKRTTVSIPGTGISYVTESGKKSKSSKNTYNTNHSQQNYTTATERGNSMTWGKFVICFFFGFLGVHKFMEKKTGMGVLYLFTLGLFGLGWIIDSGKYLIAAIKGAHLNADEKEELAEQETAYQSSSNPVELPPENPKKTIKHALIWAAALVFALTCFISCSADSGESTDPENTVPPTILTEVTTEPTAEPTAEPTTEPTEEATAEPETDLTEEATTEPITEPTAEPTTEPATEPTEDTAQDYVANKNSHKFHYPTCSSVDSMKSSNRWDYHGTREELISMGYEPCGRCHP